MSITYSGHVFDRKNGSPLANIPVSDGRNIAFTDENGAFFLEGWERARIINVCVLTERHNDWYISIDGHKGDFNFYISKTDTSSSEYAFLHTSDTEIENRYDDLWMKFIKKTCDDVSPAFFIHTGDLCREDGVKRHFLALNRETCGCPVRYCIGNHDFIGDAYGEEIYEKLYGPTWYSFDYGNIHYISLSIGIGDNPSGYSIDDQWKWLVNDVEKVANGKKIVIFCHHLCVTDPTGFTRTVDGKTIDLKQMGLAAWVFGHYHFHLAHEYNGILNLSTSRPDSGGIDSSPAGLRRVSVNDSSLSSDVLYNICEADEKTAPLWHIKVGGNVEFSAPLIADGKLFVAANDDGIPKKCAISAIDPKSGKLLGTFKTDGGIKGDIAFSDGKIYAQDTYGNVYCLNASDMSVVWRKKAAMPTCDYTRMGVVVAKDLVIAGSSGHLTAFDKNDGKTVWDSLLRNCESTPAKTIYDAKRKRLYASLHWFSMACYDLDSGKVLWENCDRPFCWFRSSTPYIFEDGIFTGGLYTMAKLCPDTGKTLLTAPAKGRMDVCGAPAFDGKTFFFPTGDKGVIGVDKETLEAVSFFPSSKTGLYSSPYLSGNISTVESEPILNNDTLIFTASDGYIYFYNKDTAELKKKICIGSPCLTAPVIFENTVITADFCGNVCAFSL